ncbi:hypothetical protein [Propionicicella superfundia]|uniref:hypothetical protein n=1 Tax=Propionicicella superfundia TaxID=348582 RepID=UPI00041AC508|nr:hypothetical protein [Propionicicella superfundia]
MSIDGLRRAVAYAVTRSDIALPPADRWRVADLVGDLAAAGWGRDRIAALAAGPEPWPCAVPAPIREGTGAAQVAAAVREVRTALGLTGLASPTVSNRRRLTADERRLMDDVPPHYR